MHCHERKVIDKKTLNRIAQDYCTLDYSPRLAGLLGEVFPETNFCGLQKYELHKRLNEVIVEHYNGEEVLKYALFNYHYKKNIVAAFEMRVNKSRADFLAINGVSSSFEIKSSLDNLYKLHKQSSDYSLVFDYNYIVVDEKHLENAKEIVPKCFGIWSFDSGKRIVHRKAAPNDKINPEVQLRLLTKKELVHQFKEHQGCIRDILKENNAVEINSRFKVALKQRYKIRWQFLLTHQESILPIDLQFFFKQNIDPSIVYGYHC
jgi:hypothetical protein